MMRTPVTAEHVHGALDVERTRSGVRPHRLPTGIRSRDADAQLLSAEAQPSGVRVVVRTTARQVALELRASRVVYRGVQRPRGVVDVVVDGGAVRSTALEHGDSIEVDLSTGASTPRSGDADVVTVTDLQPGEKQIEFWLPHNEQVELIALHTDEPVGPGLAGGRVWVHHGSSISHGSNATRPTGIWPVVAARRAGVDLINLGFGGSALVDPFMARLIRDTPADVISLKLGINVVNLDAMRLRSFVPAVHGFLDTIREGTRRRRCSWSRRSTAASTRTRRAPERSTRKRSPAESCGSSPPVSRRTPIRAGSRCGSSGNSSRRSPQLARTRPCRSWTAARSTALATPRRIPSRTRCTRVRRRIG